MALPNSGMVLLRADGGDADVTLRHELAHVALHRKVKVRVPLWFDEGYAVLASREYGGLAALQLNLAVAAGRVPTLAALDAVCKQTGEEEVNLIGYCLGGTLLGSTLGYNAVKKDKRIVSATFFVALLAFSIPGELGVFIDEQQVASLEKKMQERGYLEGSEMGTTFNIVRSNDLICA